MQKLVSIQVCIGLMWVVLLGEDRAGAYPVAPALPLDKLVDESDLLCKASVVSSKEVEDGSFDKIKGYRPHETRLKIIAVYRGPAELNEIAFHHYGPVPNEGGFAYAPQHYQFEAGRTYILFAKKTERDGEYRQLWKQHRTQEDQGLLLAANNDAHEGLPIRDIFWRELTGLLKSDKSEDVNYGLSHLDLLSGGDYRNIKDLDREQVLSAVAPTIKSSNSQIAQAAIAVLGSHNPYMSPDYAPGWLATVGKGHIPGYGTWDTSKPNVGSKLHWQQLIAVVQSDAVADTRSLAIRALGRGAVEEVLPLAEKWLGDPQAKVRGAAAVLLADYPDKANQELLKRLTQDPESLARQGLARAIGFGQFSQLIPELGTLVEDDDPHVAEAAALSLLSFALELNRDTLKAHLEHAEYHAVFLNALAQENPEPYLGQLCEVIRKNKQPKNWWGGFIPWADSWNMLYKHVQAQSVSALQDPTFTSVLDALEFPAVGDPAAPSYYSSSEPRDLYALYVQRGLTDRAKRFRASARKAFSYDIDYYFKMVDMNPEAYGQR